MSKIIPVIFLFIAVVICAGIAYKYYSDANTLEQQNISLTQEIDDLYKKNSDLSQDAKKAKREADLSQKQLGSLKGKYASLENLVKDWESRYDELLLEKQEIEKQLKEKPKPTPVVSSAIEKTVKPELVMPDEAKSDVYWGDVLQERALLRVNVEKLAQKLKSYQSDRAEYEAKNTELMMKLDDVEQKVKALLQDLSDKEKAISDLSNDVVTERKKREELAKQNMLMKNSNMELKHELVSTKKQKANLQKKYEEVLAKATSLEKQVNEIETVMFQKKMLFSELEQKLSAAVTGKSVDNKNLKVTAESVELPPIVVKPDIAVHSLKGEVLALNKNDNFVIINIGQDTGVKPGMSFNVLRGEDVIGKLEVIETRREISAADIKEMYAGGSIREGDVVVLN